jgi:hypothetical protein
MNLARMEQAPVVGPDYGRKETFVIPTNTRISALSGVIISSWLSIFSLLVMTSIWLLINLRVIKYQKSQGINFKELL